MTRHAIFAPFFDYNVHGAAGASYCPALDAPCAVEMGEDKCPIMAEECPEEGIWDMVYTESGIVVPDPLTNPFVDEIEE